MMHQLKCLVLTILLAIEVNCNALEGAKVEDTKDEAQKQLDELKTIVQGKIYAGRDKLGNIFTDFLTFNENVLNQGELALQQEGETIYAQLTTIKELAHAAGKDITNCTKEREGTLRNLSMIFSQEIFHCILGKNRAAEKIIEDALYLIDININKVHELQNQLDRCGDNILCIAPLLTEIQLDMVKLPQNIDTEVGATEGLVVVLRLSVEECATIKVSEYSSEANTILTEIINCANNIINN